MPMVFIGGVGAAWKWKVVNEGLVLVTKVEELRVGHRSRAALSPRPGTVTTPLLEKIQEEKIFPAPILFFSLHTFNYQ